MSETPIEVLRRSTSDPRVSAAFGDATVVSLCLWTLELREGESSDTRLLYAWAIPCAEPLTPRWFETDPKPRARAGGRYTLRRSAVVTTSTTALALLDALLGGANLAIAAERVDLPMPTFAGSMRLASNASEAAAAFAVPPIAFMQTKSTLGFENGRGESSPHVDVPGYVIRLFLIKKAALYRQLTGPSPLPDADLLLAEVLAYLESETGLLFKANDSGRLGNIEWLVLPSLGPHERRTVFVETSSAGEKRVRVLVRVQRQPGDANAYVVRCRLGAGGTVIDDVVARLNTLETDAEFLTVSDVDNVYVTVWRTTAGGEILWYEQRLALMKQIQFNMGVLGLGGELRSDWLTKLDETRARRTAAEVRRLQQSDYSHGFEVGERYAWIESARMMRATTHRMFPVSSGAAFFPKQWGNGEDVPGRLKFTSWFVDKLSGLHSGRVVLIDPYFDTFGVELLARCRSSSIEIVVLTNTQVASDEDVGRAGLASARRAERIREACRRVSAIFASLRVRILDLRSTGGGDSRLFHDRYLLAFDSDGEIAQGFTLSSSLQSVAQRHPLLVTPIPSDVLADVRDYVEQLLTARAPAVEAATVEQLFGPAKAPRTFTPQKAYEYPDAPEFLARFYGDPQLASLQGDALERALADRRLLREDASGFLSDDATAEHVRGYITWLNQLSSEAFDVAWVAFANWLARTTLSFEWMDDAAATAGGALTARVAGYVRRLHATVRGSAAVADGSRESHSILHYLQMSFPRAMGEAHIVLDHFDKYPAAPWGLHYAADVLVTIAPDLAVEVVDELVIDAGSGDAAKECAGYVVRPFIATMIETLVLTQGRVELALLRARTSFVRALAAQALVSRASDGHAGWDDVSRALGVLPTVEQFEVYAGWVSRLRVAANRSSGLESEELRRLRHEVFQRLCDLWPTESVEWNHILQRLSGPILGSWARSTTVELLFAVAALGKVTVDEILAAWDAVLHRRMGEHFYAAADLEVFSAWALSFSRATGAARRTALDGLEAARKEPMLIIRQPFMRSRDYDRYATAIEKLLRVEAVTGMAFCESGDDAALRIHVAVRECMGRTAVEETHLARTDLVFAVRAVEQHVDARLKGESGESG